MQKKIRTRHANKKHFMCAMNKQINLTKTNPSMSALYINSEVNETENRLH